MTSHKIVPLLAIGALALASSGAAFAQTAARQPAAGAAAPAAAAGPVVAGPVIPGVCIFSNEQAIGTSAVGKYVGQRIQQLSAAANAEVQAEKTGIETDGKTLDTQKASLSQDAYQQRALALNQRVTALQRKAQTRSRELEATEQKALGRIATEVNPLLRQVYAQRGCGLLLDRNAVFGSNPSMDVTADVVKLLDAKITQFPFEREHLDDNGAPAGGPAAPGGR
ncbi:MAG: OmpH family outer membrane protein, partial [Caulobacteraceae bacterium]